MFLYLIGFASAIALMIAARYCPRLVQVIRSKSGNRYIAVRIPQLPRRAALGLAIAAAVALHLIPLIALVLAR